MSIALTTIAGAAGLAGVGIARSHAVSLESYTNQISDINEFKLDLKMMRYKSGYISPLFTNNDIYESLLETATGTSASMETFGPMVIGGYDNRTNNSGKTLYTGIQRLMFVKAKELSNRVSFNIPSGTAVSLNRNQSTFTLPVSGIPTGTLQLGRHYMLCTLNGSFIVTLTGISANALNFSTAGTYKINDTLTARLPVAIVTEQASLKGIDILELRTPTAQEVSAGDKNYKFVHYDLYAAGGATSSARPVLSNLDDARAEFTSSVNWQSFSFSNGSTINFTFNLKKSATDGIERKPVDVTMVF
ncbi:MAG: hypothetical protein J7501_06885 [Bdellovibrio sp.]|nr:hypothetical protein [Bdellovibrio sp.]